MDKLVVVEIFEILRICRTISHFLGVRDLTCHLIHIRFSLKIRLRNLLTRDCIYCIKLFQIGRSGVECNPLLIQIAVHTAVYTREKHVQLGIHLNLGLIVAFHIIITTFLRFCRIRSLLARSQEAVFGCRHGTFHAFCIHRLALLYHLLIARIIDKHRRPVLTIGDCIGHDSHQFLLGSRIKCFAIDQRILAILLTVQIRSQVKYVVGRILVHRCVCAGADKNKRVAGITDKYDSNAPHHIIQYS